MGFITAFLFGVLVALAMRPLVNVYVLSRAAHRYRVEPSAMRRPRGEHVR